MTVRPGTIKIIQEVLGYISNTPRKIRCNNLYDSLYHIFSIKEKNGNLHRALDIKKAH